MPREISFTANVEIQASADGVKQPRVSILGYSGGEMSVGGFGPVVVALEGIELPTTVPLLSGHDASLDGVVGSGAPKISGGKLLVDGTLAMSAAAAQKIVDLHRAGVQFSASIGAEAITKSYIRAGEKFSANNRSFVAGENGLTLVSRSRLREVSIVPLGADPGASVSIAARAALRGFMNKQSFEDWVQSMMGVSVDTLSAEALTGLRANYEGKPTPATAPVIHASAADRDAAESQRVERINAVADEAILTASDDAVERIEAVRSRAITAGWDERRADLEILRAGRPQAHTVYAPRRERTGGKPADVLTAALMTRCGFESAAEKHFGEVVMESAKPFMRASLIDICRAAVQADGKQVTHDRSEMIRAAFSTYSLPTALGNTANKTLEVAYLESPASWRGFAAVRPAANFKSQTSIRPSFLTPLEPLANGGEIKHGVIDESTFNWSIATFAKQLGITRTDLINDDTSLFSETAPALGRSAARGVSDLVATTIMANAGTFFGSGNANLLDSAGSALSLTSLASAITAMRQQRDAQGNDLDIMPRVLLVPPELEIAAKEILQSEFIQHAAEVGGPTGNALRNSLTLAVEPRLSNTAKFANASAAKWYLFASPSDVPLVVGFLDGRQVPTVEFFGLDHDVNVLGVHWRVYFDYGCALADFHGAVRSDGVAPSGD